MMTNDEYYGPAVIVGEPISLAMAEHIYDTLRAVGLLRDDDDMPDGYLEAWFIDALQDAGIVAEENLKLVQGGTGSEIE